MRPRCRSTRAFFQRFHRGSLADEEWRRRTSCRIMGTGRSVPDASEETGRAGARAGSAPDRMSADASRRGAAARRRRPGTSAFGIKKSCRPATAAFPADQGGRYVEKVVQLLGVVMMIASGNASAQTGDIPFHELSVGNVNVRVVSLVQKDLERVHSAAGHGAAEEGRGRRLP